LGRDERDLVFRTRIVFSRLVPELESEELHTAVAPSLLVRHLRREVALAHWAMSFINHAVVPSGIAN